MESGAVAVELNLRAPAAIPETPISPEILEFVPSLCSGSFSDIGMRRDMEDEHICIDDLFLFVKSQCRCCIPSSFMGYLMAIVVLMQHHTSGGMPSGFSLKNPYSLKHPNLTVYSYVRSKTLFGDHFCK
ncbi:probable protein phosphatase 2C 47 [Asparagus officinalis]|uniref:probable protein phosphatase 2C 47 n=1 Tax=Asparagus officinalis TaxID=4686 RepID=UPI00098E468F|nr:probable protein phosphatase 2C 47 [Asparagus officinalis]